MVLQPGMQRVSTRGSLRAFQSSSTGTRMFSTPPISSFTNAPLPSEQPLRQTAIDGGALRIREPRLRDDFGWRKIADRKRHVRSHHDPVGADDIGEIAQRARVLHDGVV